MIFLNRDSFLEKFFLDEWENAFVDQRGTLSWAEGKFIISRSRSRVFRGLHRDQASEERKNIFVLQGSIREFILTMTEDGRPDNLFAADLLIGDSFSVPQNAFHGFFCWEEASLGYFIEGAQKKAYKNLRMGSMELKNWLDRQNAIISNDDRQGLVSSCV